MGKNEMMEIAIQEMRRQMRENEIADDIAQTLDALEILKLARGLSGQDIHGYSYQTEDPDNVAIFEKEDGLWYYRGNMADDETFYDLLLGMAHLAYPVITEKSLSVPELIDIYL